MGLPAIAIPETQEATLITTLQIRIEIIAIIATEIPIQIQLAIPEAIIPTVRVEMALSVQEASGVDIEAAEAAEVAVVVADNNLN